MTESVGVQFDIGVYIHTEFTCTFSDSCNMTATNTDILSINWCNVIFFYYNSEKLIRNTATPGPPFCCCAYQTLLFFCWS